MTDKKISELNNYTPAIDADSIPIVDYTTSSTKKITWANIKATLKTYFDTLYATLTGAETFTNKTLTTPVIASLYQDAGKTKTVTMPAATDTLVGKATTDTLTNKRITKRVGTSASAATHTIDSDSYDMFTVTAQAEAVTFAAPSGKPTQGQLLLIRIKDNGTARAITWNAIFRAGTDVSLPTTTALSKTLYVGFAYNSTDSKWDCVFTTDGF